MSNKSKPCTGITFQDVLKAGVGWPSKSVRELHEFIGIVSASVSIVVTAFLAAGPLRMTAFSKL